MATPHTQAENQDPEQRLKSDPGGSREKKTPLNTPELLDSITSLSKTCLSDGKSDSLETVTHLHRTRASIVHINAVGASSALNMIAARLPTALKRLARCGLVFGAIVGTPLASAESSGTINPSSVTVHAPLLSAQEIAAIDLSDALEDDSWVAPIAASLENLATNPERQNLYAALIARIHAWPPTSAASIDERVSAWLNATALADLSRSDVEAEIAFAAFTALRREPDQQGLLQATARIAVERGPTPVLTTVPAIGIESAFPAEIVSVRMALLARKLVGRLTGRIPR